MVERADGSPEAKRSFTFKAEGVSRMSQQRFADIANFLIEFSKAPKKVGAVAPSSPYLSRELIFGHELQNANVVLEYGPGTGAFTQDILTNLGDQTKFIAFEVNPQMTRILRKRYPTMLVYEESVDEVPKVLADLNISKVDCIVSSLPWASFDRDTQDRILGITRSVLKDGGSFSTFAYFHGLALPSAQAFRRALSTYFSDVSISDIIWRNVPHALVNNCRK